MQNSKSDFTNETLRKKRDLPTGTINFEPETAKTSLPYYQNLINMVNDDTMNEIIMNFMENNCNDFLAQQDKRSGKVVGKKIKFHSWGGKRNSAGAGKFIDSQPKMVIRNPFHSWGGKRSYVNNNEMKFDYDENQ